MPFYSMFSEKCETGDAMIRMEREMEMADLRGTCFQCAFASQPLREGQGNLTT